MSPARLSVGAPAPASKRWAELLGEQRDNLVRIAHLRLYRDVSGGDAEDVVHEVFLRVVSRAPDPGQISRPVAYLKQAVVNECVTRWRRHHREVAIDEMPDRYESDHADECVTKLAVRAALDLLTPRQRSVVALGFLYDYSDEEVAAALGIEPVTVRTLRARALRRMRTALAAADAVRAVTRQDSAPGPRPRVACRCCRRQARGAATACSARLRSSPRPVGLCVPVGVVGAVGSRGRRPRVRPARRSGPPR